MGPRFLVFSLVLLLAACASRDRFVGERAIVPAGPYVAALKNASRHIEHVEDLAVHMQVYATLLSPEFLESYQAEYRRTYGIANTDETITNGKLTLVLAVEANDRQWTDLGALNKLWTLSFADGATAPVVPDRIERFDRDSLYFRYFFPYWSPWQQIYRIEFPLKPTGSGTLLLQGVGGTVRLAW
jgi:hypothetical protein